MELSALGPGFHTISKAEYHRDPCPRPSLSASAAKTLIDESPAHAWYFHPRGGGGQRDSTEAMDRGTLLDSLLLGGDTDIVVLPEEYADFRTKAAQAIRDEAVRAGKLPIVAEKFGAAKAKADAIRKALESRGIVFDGVNQQTIIWQEDSAAGPVYCRGRLDHWKPTEGVIYDLKIVADARPKALRRKMVDDGHHIQGTAYPSGIGRLMPELAGRLEMKFIYVVPEPPYADNITIATLGGPMRALGRFHWSRAVEAWGRGVHGGRWPGWSVGEIAIEPMPYALIEMDEAVAGGSPDVSF